jgi:hypothetical protein
MPAAAARADSCAYVLHLPRCVSGGDSFGPNALMAEVDTAAGHGAHGSSGAEGIGAHLDGAMRAPAGDSEAARQLIAMQTGMQVRSGAYMKLL